jgi:hypothetical protein
MWKTLADDSINQADCNYPSENATQLDHHEKAERISAKAGLVCQIIFKVCGRNGNECLMLVFLQSDAIHHPVYTALKHSSTMVAIRRHSSSRILFVKTWIEVGAPCTSSGSSVRRAY